ncbi:hypothetical protein [Flavobacterium sp. '19STA2R22 D10 B1']|uniref:hypothetical protein n=1 Tax=Flavobacterium aerium TaxID=3037261 RepID=UPI00278C263F|nr:hypothetical protein [Flavobacterium sp. '19STA2R22 D10 B1']
MESQKTLHRENAKEQPTEAFTETEMLLIWNKYSERLRQKGHMIMATYMQINDPTLQGSDIHLELPNEGAKVDFDNEKHGLLGYIRGKLHNHLINIIVTVNETVEKKYAFTSQDKYDRLREKNPNLDILRKTFDLDVL